MNGIPQRPKGWECQIDRVNLHTQGDPFYAEGSCALFLIDRIPEELDEYRVADPRSDERGAGKVLLVVQTPSVARALATGCAPRLAMHLFKLLQLLHASLPPFFRFGSSMVIMSRIPVLAMQYSNSNVYYRALYDSYRYRSDLCISAFAEYLCQVVQQGC